LEYNPVDRYFEEKRLKQTISIAQEQLSSARLRSQKNQDAIKTVLEGMANNKNQSSLQ
jgi:hypothetical protein